MTTKKWIRRETVPAGYVRNASVFSSRPSPNLSLLVTRLLGTVASLYVTEMPLNSYLTTAFSVVSICGIFHYQRTSEPAS